MGLFADAAESWTERLKLRLMLGIIVVFIASIVASCNEMRYLAWGQTVSAKVNTVAQVTTRGRYGSTSEKIRIEYSFRDGDLGTRTEEDDVSMTFLDPQQVANAGVVDVQYLPGTLDRSRLKGHTYLWLTIPLFVSAALATVFGIRFWRDFKDHERRSKAASALYSR